MRKFLNGLYEKIRNYEKEKDKAGKEVEKIKGEITNLSTSLSFTDNLSKIEKMKKQMDLSFLQSKLELAEMQKENSSNSNLVNLEKEINSEMSSVESTIYVITRFNEETNLESLPELSSIYEYYKKISDVENEIIKGLLQIDDF